MIKYYQYLFFEFGVRGTVLYCTNVILRKAGEKTNRNDPNKKQTLKQRGILLYFAKTIDNSLFPRLFRLVSVCQSGPAAGTSLLKSTLTQSACDAAPGAGDHQQQGSVTEIRMEPVLPSPGCIWNVEDSQMLR